VETDPLTEVLEQLGADRFAPEAWEKLYRILWPWVMSYMYRRMLGNRPGAEDASQDVMSRLLRNAVFDPKPIDSKKFRSYVLSVCRSVAVDHFRGLASRPDTAINLDVGAEESVVSSLPDPEQLQITRDMMELVAGRLSKTDRQLAGLLLDGFTPQEIAKQLNRSIKMTYEDLTALRRCIREILIQEGRLR